MFIVKKSVYLIQRYTRDYLHSILIDFDAEDFIQRTLIPLESLFSTHNLLDQELQIEAFYHLIYYYFVFDDFAKINDLALKFPHMPNLVPENTARIIFNQKKLKSMILISAQNNLSPLKPITISDPEKNQNIENEAEIEISYGNFSFLESQEIYHLEKNEISLESLNIPLSDRIKTANYLLLEGFISEDYEIMKKVNDEYESIVKENSEKESQLLSDPYLGLLILNLFKTTTANLMLVDLLESFSLVIELHGIPKWEKFFLLLHSCEKIVRDQEKKKETTAKDGEIKEKNNNNTGNNANDAIDLEYEDETIIKYKEIVNGFKKIISSVYMKLKKVEATFNSKFLLELFREYLRPNENNEIHSDLIISIAICFVYLEIKMEVVQKNLVKQQIQTTGNSKAYLLSFWNFLKTLKNNKKYEIVKTFFQSVTSQETLSFLKAIILIYLINFKHYFHNSIDVEIKENQNIFTFNPMNSISFDENEEFKILNNQLKGEKPKIKFDDYEEDKQIISHYLNLAFKREKEIEKLLNAKNDDNIRTEVQSYTREKKTLIEKIKFHFLTFNFKKSLRYLKFF